MIFYIIIKSEEKYIARALFLSLILVSCSLFSSDFYNRLFVLNGQIRNNSESTYLNVKVANIHGLWEKALYTCKLCDVLENCIDDSLDVVTTSVMLFVLRNNYF